MNEEIKKGREVFGSLKLQLDKHINALIEDFEKQTGATVIEIKSSDSIDPYFYVKTSSEL